MAQPTLTINDRASASPQPTAGVAASPKATRVPGRRWRDWRLALGVALVLGSAILGARVVAAADDTVAVWAADGDLVAGTLLSADDLVPVAVRIEAPVNPYLTGAVPDGYVVSRDVRDGELVPATAVATAEQAGRTSRLVALALAPEALPGRLSTGDRVDVWLVPESLSEPDAPASLLVADVSVAATPVDDTGFGSATGQRSVVISLDADAVAEAGQTLQDVTARLVAASAAGRVALTLDPAPR